MPNYGNNETNGAYCLAADEDHIVFSSYRAGGYGWMNSYISFKKPDSTWSEAQNMGGVINSKGNEDWPKVSPDESYLFYVRSGDVYRVDIKIIDEFKMRRMLQRKKAENQGGCLQINNSGGKNEKNY